MDGLIIDVIIQILFITYIVVGSYHAGKTAPKSGESIVRVMKALWGWPFYWYKELREEDKIWKDEN